MSEVVIKVENLSKQYRLGQIGTGTISHDLNRWWSTLRGKEDPYLKIGETNDRTKKGNSQYAWALKGINFEVKKGEILGVIGKNGAGKSTLLKILSKVTGPTQGSIKSKGRIASLLEVGTGFHPEMTGRENIYMNGTLMGMSRYEVSKKLDEIVDFAGITRYLDTPTKRYSSGMTVRLGFAIAAHLEPEILIVDEVLAVGDAEFQKKAIGKMQDVSKGEGRTVLFVSHNMASIQHLCTKSLVLENGKISYNGLVDEGIKYYLQNNITSNKINLSERKDRKGNGKAKFVDFKIENSIGQQVLSIFSGEEIILIFKIEVYEDIDNLDIGFSLHSSDEKTIGVLYSSYQGTILKNIDKGIITVKCAINELNLSPDRIKIGGRLSSGLDTVDWPNDNLGYLNVELGDFYKTGSIGFKNKTVNLIKGNWNIAL